MRKWTWRKPPQDFSLGSLQPNCGFSIIVQGAIWSSGKSELVEYVGNANNCKYIVIFEKGLLPIFSSRVLNKSSTLFMQVCAPVHITKNAKEMKGKHDIHRLAWPKQSWNMNLIEHVLFLVHRQIFISLQIPNENERRVGIFLTIFRLVAYCFKFSFYQTYFALYYFVGDSLFLRFKYFLKQSFLTTSSKS